MQYYLVHKECLWQFTLLYHNHQKEDAYFEVYIASSMKQRTSLFTAFSLVILMETSIPLHVPATMYCRMIFRNVCKQDFASCHRRLASFPGHSHLQSLIMQTQRGKAWEKWSHVVMSGRQKVGTGGAGQFMSFIHITPVQVLLHSQQEGIPIMCCL